MILRYREKEIVNYKASVRFKRGLERSWVILYRYGYYITLTHFKVRYHRLQLEKDSFIDYHEDHHVLIVPKMPFNDSPDSLPHPDAQLAISYCIGLSRQVYLLNLFFISSIYSIFEIVHLTSIVSQQVGTSFQEVEA